MRLKFDFEVVEMDDDYIAVPVGDGASNVHGVLRLNSQGKELFDLLHNDITKDEIVEYLCSKYDNDRCEMESYVEEFLVKLNEAILLQ